MGGFRLARKAEELLQRVEAQRLGVDPGARHRPHLQAGADDEPGQTQAANGGAKPVGGLRARAVQPAAVGALQLQAEQMVTQRAGTVVVLAMHVVGDGAAQGHEARARRHRQEPAARVTGRNQPRGSSSWMISSSITPASHSSTPVCGSKLMKRSSPRVSHSP